MEKYTELLNLGNNGIKGWHVTKFRAKLTSKLVDITTSKAFEIWKINKKKEIIEYNVG